MLPREPEVHGLVALMELQASRFDARTGADGEAERDGHEPGCGRGEAVDLAALSLRHDPRLHVLGGDGRQAPAEGKDGERDEDRESGGQPAAERGGRGADSVLDACSKIIQNSVAATNSGT